MESQVTGVQAIPHWLSNLNMSEMELTALQHCGKKKTDELRRIRGAWDSGKFPLTGSKKTFVLKCAETIEVNGELRLQEVVDSILATTIIGDEGDYIEPAAAE
jgi:hypothetical protein